MRLRKSLCEHFCFGILAFKHIIVATATAAVVAAAVVAVVVTVVMDCDIAVIVLLL